MVHVRVLLCVSLRAWRLCVNRPRLTDAFSRKRRKGAKERKDHTINAFIEGYFDAEVSSVVAACSSATHETNSRIQFSEGSAICTPTRAVP